MLTDGVRRSVARDAVDKFFASLPTNPLPPSDSDSFHLLQWRGALGPARAPKAPQAAALWRETRSKNLRPVPGIEDFLLGLRGRYKLGLVAPGGPRARQEIESLGLGPFFDALVVKEADSREIFEEAFRRLDVVSMECALVCSDSSAKRAASRCCGVTVFVDGEGATTSAREDEEEEGIPDFVIREVRQLPDLLPERRGFSSLCQDRRLGFFHSLRDEGWTSVG